MLTKVVRASLLFCLAMTVEVRCISAHAQQPAERLQKIIEDNTLEREGKKPFHLKIAFQLYDLEGKPSETGTVEEWWVSKTQRRIDINAPSYNKLPPTTEPVPVSYFRERALVDELLRAEVQPLPNYTNLDGFNVSEVKRTEDKMPLHCILVASKNVSSTSVPLPNYCFDTANDALRLRIDAYGDTVSRNSIGSFHDANVALDLQVAFGDHLAMTGHVVSLNTFDPSTSAIQFAAPDDNSVNVNDHPELVAAGHSISRVQPQFPSIAKVAHLSGLVVLHARIGKDGSMKEISAISVSNPMFLQPAVDAVSQWKYTPFMLKGNPVEVDTTIYVNFKLNSF